MAARSSTPLYRRPEARLPVTVITGFLGSGKTTLVKHILTNQHGLRTAVIVNEFSDIGIDRELIMFADDDMVELENGCICCSINNNFVDTIFRILDRGRAVDYLVVETTGLADPLPVVLTFLRSEFRDAIRVDSIITVADAASFCLDLFESQAARNQLLYGDVILLNKCDLVVGERLQAVEDAIRAVKPGARILRTTQCRVALPLLLSVGLFQSDRFFVDHDHRVASARHLRHDDESEGQSAHDHSTHGGGHDHVTADGFESLSFQSDQPLSAARFQDFLERLPDNVYRGKGLLWIEQSEQHYVFHLVAKRFALDPFERDGPVSNKLVLIGRDLDRERLRNELEACLAPLPAPPPFAENDA